MAASRPAGPSAPAIDRVRGLLADDAAEHARERREGYLDVIGAEAPRSTGRIQDLMLTGAVPLIYERWWRPALGRVAKGPFGPGMEDEYRIAADLLGLAEGDAVLDVACGSGNFTRRFARLVAPGGLAVGVDLSETMLDRAVRDTAGAGLASAAAYVRGDATAPPFVDGVFDGVCCFAALHLFADPEAALDRMTALLAPGGRIAILTTALARSEPTRTWQSLGGRVMGARMFEADELAGLLEERGFGELRRRGSGVTEIVGGRLS